MTCCEGIIVQLCAGHSVCYNTVPVLPSPTGLSHKSNMLFSARYKLCVMYSLSRLDTLTLQFYLLDHYRSLIKLERNGNATCGTRSVCRAAVHTIYSYSTKYIIYVLCNTNGWRIDSSKPNTPLGSICWSLRVFSEH